MERTAVAWVRGRLHREIAGAELSLQGQSLERLHVGAHDLRVHCLYLVGRVGAA
jgi:hypothetical protein